MTEHKSLAEALAAFQGEAPKLHKGNTAEVVSKRTGGKYSYKYVDLADVVEAVQPILLKHGLSFSAFPCVAPDGKPALRYTLRHVGGDVESEVMPLMLAAEDAQALGSAITYGRRYALCAVLNIVADADDDGAAAKSAQERASRTNGSDSRQPTAAAQQATERPASASQRGMLNARAAGKDEKGKQAHEPLAPSEFANVLLAAAGGETREFESQEHAQQFVNRNLDRLPARLVTAVLEEMARLRNEVAA